MVDKATRTAAAVDSRLSLPHHRYQGSESRGRRSSGTTSTAPGTSAISLAESQINMLSATALSRRLDVDGELLLLRRRPRAGAAEAEHGQLPGEIPHRGEGPADVNGTAALTWRYRDPDKRDSSWTYVPALRRVRAVSPANRSDGFLGSDMSQDDGTFFEGKPEDFTWKLVGEDGSAPDRRSARISRASRESAGRRPAAGTPMWPDIAVHRLHGSEVEGPRLGAAHRRGSRSGRYWIVEGDAEGPVLPVRQAPCTSTR